MSTPLAPDLTTYPKVTIDGTEHEVRLDIFDVIALEKQGVDLLRATDYDQPGPDGSHPSILERSLKILAQGIHAGIGWEDLARTMQRTGMGDSLIRVSEAIKKVRAQISGAIETAPAVVQPPQVN